MLDRLLRRFYRPYREKTLAVEEVQSLRSFINVEMMNSLKRQRRYLELLEKTIEKIDANEKNRDYYVHCTKRLRDIYERDLSRQRVWAKRHKLKEWCP